MPGKRKAGWSAMPVAIGQYARWVGLMGSFTQRRTRACYGADKRAVPIMRNRRIAPKA